MTTNKYATLRGTIARAKRNDCQKVVMRVTLVEELLLQLSNAKKQVASLAAEVQAVRWAAGQVYSAGYNHGHLNTADELPYASDEELLQRGNEVLIEFTDPDHSGNVSDAFLAEVRASAFDEFARSHDEQAKKYYEMSPGCSAQYEYQFAAGQAWYFAECIRKGVQS